MSIWPYSCGGLLRQILQSWALCLQLLPERLFLTVGEMVLLHAEWSLALELLENSVAVRADLQGVAVGVVEVVLTHSVYHELVELGWLWLLDLLLHWRAPVRRTLYLL